MIPKPLLFACLLTALCSCSAIKYKVAQANVDSQVNNIVWEVSSYKGRAVNAKDFPGGIPTITFYMQDGKIGGSDGCNSFMGVATYRGNSIKTGPIASTKMACPAGGIQDDFYTTISSPGLTYKLVDGVLRLFVNDAEVMALKERE